MDINQAQPSEASSFLNNYDSSNRNDSSNQQQGYYEPKAWTIQGTKQERQQQPKLSPEELVGMQTASYALLNQLLAMLGKKERGSLIAISEVLSAFKEGKASELEVIACFFTQVKAGNMIGLENKKAILSEIASGIPTEHSEQLWQYIRKWAGSKASLPMFNQLIVGQESRQLIAFHAKNWFVQQQSEALNSLQMIQALKLNKQMEEIAAKSESKIASTREEKITALASKATRTKLSDEEITYLFTFADDEITNKAMEAQMELASKQQAKEKIRSGNISSEDI